MEDYIIQPPACVKKNQSRLKEGNSASLEDHLLVEACSSNDEMQEEEDDVSETETAMTNKGNKVRTNVLNNSSSLDDDDETNDDEDKEKEEPDNLDVDKHVASCSYKHPSYLALQENCPVSFSTLDRLSAN